jgi:hypothetical protein
MKRTLVGLSGVSNDDPEPKRGRINAGEALL